MKWKQTPSLPRDATLEEKKTKLKKMGLNVMRVSRWSFQEEMMSVVSGF